MGNKNADLAFAHDPEARRVTEELHVAWVTLGEFSVVHVRVTDPAQPGDLSLRGTRVARSPKRHSVWACRVARHHGEIPAGSGFLQRTATTRAPKPMRRRLRFRLRLTLE